MSKRMTIRKGKKLHKIGAAIVAMLLVVAMVIGYLPDAGVTLAKELTSDLNTTGKFTESLGDNASTEYAGRVWTDKSVFTGDASFSSLSGETQTIKKVDDNDELTDEDDFLVSFSALATAQSVTGKAQAPIDVVFVIDMSGSMSNQNSNMTNSQGQTYSRIKFTVDAVNKAIEDLMELNPYTRVGVVGFNESGTTLLELGRYTKSGNNQFFSLSTNTGNNNYATLYTRAVNSSGNRISKDTSVKGGTNIQHGLYQGMSLLANADSTTVMIDGKEVKRVPSIVLLSDGSPTYSCEDKEWYAPTLTDAGWRDTDDDEDGYIDGYGIQGPGSSSYYGNGMLAIMTGAYMKAQIDEKYGVAGTPQATTVYTIGMGINDLVETNKQGQITSTADRDLARVTLNPKVYLDSTHEDYDDNNTFAKQVKNAWEAYCQATNTTPEIVVNREWVDNWGNNDYWADVEYTLTHPTSNDISGDALKNYVNLHYDADDADSIAEVFQNIVNNIAISTPQIPTEHDSANPMTSGYITYTDPIGEYMEVKTMKAVIYDGEKYLFDPTASGAIVNGTEVVNGKTVNTTTYKFSHPIEGNPVYGDTSLASLLIKVRTSEENGIKKQELEIKIPAGLIPLRVNTVELDEAGEVKSHTNNGAYPIRVLYTVGLQDAVLHEGHLDMTKISDEYLTKHPIKDGHIQFYSNLYTGTNVVGGHTAGDATVEFDAADTNQFYYMQKDTVIYADTACTEEAREIRRDGTYYYQEVYYHGNEVETKVTVRTGAELLDNTTLVKHGEGADTYWVRPAGTVRVNNMLKFKGHKLDASGTEANLTETADDFYAATYDGTTGHFKVYLGNNGVMSVEATGSLEISKAVTAADGLTAPDKDFTFTVDFEGAAGEYLYTVVDAAGNGISEGTIRDGGTIVLKANQKATIVNLPPKATYTVTEAEADGFTAYVGNEQKTSAAGTITAGTVTTAAFRNHYEVEELVFPTSGTLQGKKVLEGRNWTEDDAFTFVISAINNAPLPTGYNANTGVTVAYADAENNEATFDFGTIRYTKPGLYRYTIVEKGPENAAYLPGMTYSGALYSVVVYVVDNGDGTLSYTSNVQRLYTDDATPLFTYDDNEQLVLNPGEEAQDEVVFTNTYSADSVVRVPAALKSYEDKSGQKPLRAHMFQFTLTPLGIVGADGKVVEGTASSNPMPLENGKKVPSVTVTNEGENITFLPITFTHDDIPDGQDSITYKYQMEEVGFDKEAATDNGDNTFTLEGMTYDGNKYEIDVTVSINPGSDIVNVNSVYPNGQNIVTFRNVYDPADTEAVLKGKKILTGRNLLESDTFTFELKDADGQVLQTKTVSGVKDVNEVEFTFDNAIKYDKPGTYTYTITEKVPADDAKIAGVTYDETVWAVRVEVVDNKGVLEKTVYYNDVADTEGNAGAVFSNAYKATFDMNTAIDLYGTKKLTGRPLTTGGFYFSVKALDGAPMGARASYVPAEEDLEADANGVYEGAITFLEDVVYTEPGVYKYEITEVIPKDNSGNVIDNGVTYDESVYTVIVTVTDNYATGKLTASKEIRKNDVVVSEIEFVNAYEPDDYVYTFLPLQKVLSGDRVDPLKANEFEFVRTANTADGIEFYRVDNPATAEDESKLQVGVNGEDKVKNAADGKVSFGKIKFTKVGTYVVTIKEVIPADSEKVDGVTYDTHEIRATFRVTDDLNGKLVVTITDIHGSQIFTNRYTATGTLSGKENLKVTKILDVTSRNPATWEDSDQFTFVLEAASVATTQAIKEGKVVLPTETEPKTEARIVIDKNSKDSENVDSSVQGHWKEAEFGNIVFYAPGTYEFMIRELEGTELAMDYDTTSSRITVIATDNGKGELLITLGTDSETNPVFKNVYNVNDVQLLGHGNLHVNKEFTGRPDDAWLDSDAFNFTLAINEEHQDTKEAYEDEMIKFAENGTTLTVTKDNKGVAHFGNITFERDGTYEFIIKETNNGIPGVSYDTNQWKVVVVIERSTTVDEFGNYFLEIKSREYVKLNADGGIIQKAENEEVLTFKNTYSTTDVSLQGDKVLGVTKVISGRDWLTGDEFTFTLEAGDTTTGAALEKNTVVFNDNVDATSMSVKIDDRIAVGVIDAEAGISGKTALFDKITFYVPGTYSFLVREQGTDTATMKYDKHTATIVVEVVDNGDGKLRVNEVGSIGEMTWNNGFTPEPVSGELSGIKRISGRQITDTDKFYFSISALNDLAKTAMPENTQVTNAIPVNDEATITFGPLTFKSAGTYEYAISERTVNAHGITSDTGYVKAVVKVTFDPTTGELTAGTPTYEKVNSAGNGFEFINNYSTVGILDGSTHLKVTKHFTGRANNAWLEKDVFTFTLAAGDEVTLNATQGENPIVTLPTVTSITIGHTDTLKEKAFGSIKFTKPGDYQFVVTEVAPQGGYKDGITYDSDPERTIFVKVVDNGDGTLTASVVREADKQSELLTFNNKYDTRETTLIGSENLVVEKRIVGRDWITEDTYSFTLAADKTHALTKAALEAQDPIIVMPAEKDLHVTITKETANHKAAFGDIIFKETGTYKFTITEDIPDTGKLPSVTYDSRTKHITVVVTDNNDGTMTATAIVDNHDNLVFVNTYKAESTTAVLEGTKVMAGDRITLSGDDKYEFTISVAEGSATETPLPAELTVGNKENGTITFAPITFNKAGVYKYEIKEVIPADADKVPGVDYTTQPVTATVTVTDNNQTGKLEADVSYGSNGSVFTNTYSTESTGVVVEGTKTVTALDGNTYTMTGGEFKFEVTPVTSPVLAGDPIKNAYEVSNAADGKITFIDVTYTEPGTYTYSVTEVDGNVEWITEDSAVYTITVEVVDNGKGELVATKSIAKGSDSVGTIVFDNKYKPNVTSVLLKGLKKLNSEHKAALEAGIFKFNVEAVSGTEMVNGVETQVPLGNIPMPAVTQVTHDATGVFQFEAIEYAKPGTYVYEISEDATNKVPGYIYDDATYLVTVKVTDDGGILNKEVTGLVDANDNPTVVFTNGYVPTEVTLEGNTALKGTKTLTGRDLNAGEFEFKLTAADNATPMPTNATFVDNAVTVKNAADGGFSFEPITFSKAGTYYYTITETKNGLGGVTYDETSYTVKVEVTDKGGYLAAEVTYSALKAGAQVPEQKNSVVFENSYSAKSVPFALGAEKTLSGRVLNEKEFSFVLKEGSVELQTKDNTANGAVAFDEIEYNAAGEYVYTITEVAGDKGGVTYDTAKFEVTVKVTDNLRGELEAEVLKVVEITDEGSVEVSSKKVVFENKYAPADTSITLTGTKTLTGRDLAAGEFTFLLKNAEGDVVSQATNAADGTITFEELPFTQVGTFEYTVVEDDSAQAEGIVYDDVEYKVSVKVTDNLNGKLVAEVIDQEEIIFKNQYTEPAVKAIKMQAVNNGDATVEELDAKSGDMITYTIKLENIGNAMAKNIVLTDKVPEGLELIVGTVKGGDAIDVAEDGTITWKIFRLESGKSTEVSFQVTVPEVKEDTTWTNVATYVYDNNPNNPEDPEEPKTPEKTNKVEVTETVPNLVIVKKQRVGIGFATDKVKAVKAGDKVVYYITVTNNGNGDAEDITITDKVPAGLSVIDGSISEDGILTDGVITWNFDTIKAGDEVTVEFAVKVPAVTKDTAWKNVATVVYGNNPDNPDDPTNPEYSETPITSNEVTIEGKEVVTPITGDTATTAIWFAAAMASVLTVVGTVVRRRRRSN